MANLINQKTQVDHKAQTEANKYRNKQKMAKLHNAR